MAVSIKGTNLRNVTLGIAAPPPPPPASPLFEADFTLLSNGALFGKFAQDYNSSYANATFGTWPSGAPLYGGEPWPVDWYSETLSGFYASWYINGGRLYSDDNNVYPGIFLPLYIPKSILDTGVRITVKYIPVGTDPGDPLNKIAPTIGLYGVRTISGSVSNGEILYQDSGDQQWFLDYSDLDFNGSSNYDLGQPLWDNTEHTLVWEMSSAGRLGLTIDGNPLGNQTLEPWYTGYEPQYESYVWIGNTYGTSGDSIGSFGYTYVKVEEV